ncbi:hypothetical protein CIB48_g6204 [Xylaria polymorpha]|nr:hypothetical protein CIB48_g6204 [Xylaria polymorpha]
MSDQSDRDDDLSSDVASTPVEQDPDESGSDQEAGFFELEAEESDGYDEDEDVNENESEVDDDYDHHSEHFSFPQFSRLPPELRTMIWEAVDPDLTSKARVLDFIAIKNTREDGDLDLWESATLAQQTAPARALLATNRESRRIALRHYPDAIQLRRGLGEVRFNGANDIILLHLPQNLGGSDLHGLGRWCNKIKHLAFDNGLESYPTPRHLPTLDHPPQGLETIFYCFEASTLGKRLLDWSVAESSRQFYVETFEERPGLGEDFKVLYCWPDTTLHTDFADRVGFDYMMKFPDMPAIGSIPAKSFYEWNVGREHGSTSPLESSEGESFYESEPDDYALDGFVVNSSSEEGEEASNDEDDGLNIDGPRISSDHGGSSDRDEYEEDIRFNQNLDEFNGFSPLQDPSDDEATGNLVNVTSMAHDVESNGDHISDEPSFEEHPRVAKQSSRRKRHIVSSDDESDGDDGVVSPVETHSRVTKRARFAASDSEGDEDGNGTVRTGKTIDIFAAKDMNYPNTVLMMTKTKMKTAMGEAEEEQEEEEEDDDDHEDEEESRASKPLSLLARLRQFRSDVPVSPEGESPVSAEEYDGEGYEDENERRFSEAEFPESADEEGDYD